MCMPIQHSSVTVTHTVTSKSYDYHTGGVPWLWGYKYMTDSVKTWHNHASQNLQYKALNTMGEIPYY